MKLQGEHFRGSHLGWARLSEADSMVAAEIKLGSGQGGPRRGKLSEVLQNKTR